MVRDGSTNELGKIEACRARNADSAIISQLARTTSAPRTHADGNAFTVMMKKQPIL